MLSAIEGTPVEPEGGTMETMFLYAVGWISDNRFWIIPSLLIAELLVIACMFWEGIKNAQAEIEG